MDQMLNDYNMVKKEKRLELQLEIDQLSRQLRRKRRDMEDALLKVDEEFWPVSLFEAPTESQLLSACWESYIAFCTSKGLQLVAKTDDILLFQRKKYSQAMTKQYMANFLQNEDHREKASLLGIRVKPHIHQRVERMTSTVHSLLQNPRLKVLRAIGEGPSVGIPHARSKFKAGIRKVIGGGELSNWSSESKKNRGGGNFPDVLRMLVDSSTRRPGRFLHHSFSVERAREALHLPFGLSVPMDRRRFNIKNFNNEASALPVLRSFGVNRKIGLKTKLEDFAFCCLSEYASGKGRSECLPFLTARVGYRTKLLEASEALKKIE
ncbi:hypothetical protein Droror1_Dr00004117 [Drosera rotundifolia]